MKIKQIEWETRNNYPNYHTSVGLPFCYHASLSYCAFQWNWRIWRENRIVAYGYAFTVKDAKAECQKAWESFIMEALEVSEGCEYCTERKDIIEEACERAETGVRKNRLDVWLNGNKLHAEGDMGFVFMKGETTIGCCPMCGKKL